MTKHTPGPWEWDEYGNITADGALIARVDWRDGDRNEPLIAAAPELLSVAENFEIKGPDHDDLFWLVLKVGDYGKSFMFNLGHKDEWFASGMIEFEQRRKEVLEKAKGEQECPGPGKCNDPGCPAFYAHESSAGGEQG